MDFKKYFTEKFIEPKEQNRNETLCFGIHSLKSFSSSCSLTDRTERKMGKKIFVVVENQVNRKMENK